MAWWLKGTRTFFPENWRAFANFIPEAERDDLLGAYHRRLMNRTRRYTCRRRWP